ncbi:hypothetical protein TGME49_232150 [Toxoplasma gondii ME49]|uniref:Uncharacterized protein n=7 Tax=Toxoplasma gondii TaxID=5811 RepID=A0A0F7V0W3_TOXGV|nr:hypothetical protein TGME49_232150 [Toxoplasma gondii ME49]EPT28881.1 hypothetical protein TGME49_232150 [Toxoplasma gondii ME49]ESS35760.1 hypothetical protein TGVEG_232150 [Toxoplasma gondii VEG]CEL74894.1 TPA: hypothetical protein BN1205_023620 [Toxoplasma gondii VEG]|eukprot:XP_018636822.1 hypothetical protein TGME49_232150 [Toxoplasma gondii ME49]
MALFRGCSNVIDESLDEFLVKHDPDYAGGRGGGAAVAPDRVASSGSDETTAFLGSGVESGLQDWRDTGGCKRSPSLTGKPRTEDDGTVRIDTQKLGRALSVAVTGLGEQVKHGGELLWRSAVTAAGQVIVQHGLQTRGGSGTGLSSPSAAALISSSLSSSSLASAVSSATCFQLQLSAGQKAWSLDSAPFSLGAWLASPSVAADVWGDGNFHVILQEQRQSEDAAGQLTAEPRAKEGEGRVNPERFTYRWRRVFPNGVLVDVPDVTGNTYFISADDIGCKVQVTCSCPRSAFVGEMHASLGPFQVDSRSRSCVLNSLARGGSRFPCCAVLEEDLAGRDGRLAASSLEADRMARREEGREFFVYVNHEEVVITQRGGPATSSESESFLASGGVSSLLDRRWSARFSAEYPKLLLHSQHPKRFTVALSEEKVFVLDAYTRHQRDLVAVTLRSFHARAIVGASTLLDLVHSMSCTGRTPPAADEIISELEDKRVDLYVMVHSLCSELHSAVAGRLRTMRDWARVSKEKEALEEEMTSTIQAFQSQIADLANEQASTAAPSEGSCGNWNSRLLQMTDDMQAVRAQNRAYVEEIEQLKIAQNEMVMRLENERHTFQELLSKRLETLVEENRQLQAANEQLGSRLIKQAAEGSAGAGAGGLEAPERLQAELRRLRREVEEAHLGKHQLAHELEEMKATAARERQEKEAALASVQDGLVHMKARYDCLLEEMQALRESRDSAEEGVSQKVKVYEDLLLSRETQCSEQTKQLEAAREELSELQAERNRLKKVLESLTRDLEKSRAALDAAAARQQTVASEKQQLEIRLAEVVQRQQRQEQLSSREEQLKQQESLRRVQEAQRRADEVSRQLEETRKALQQEQQGRMLQQQRADAGSQQLAAVQSRLTEKDAQLAQMKAEIEQLRSQARPGPESESAGEGEEHLLRAKVTELTDVLARQEEEMRRLKDESSTLKTRLIKLTKANT